MEIPTWLHVTPVSGVGNDGMQLTVDPNAGVDARSALLTIQPDGGGSPCVVRIQQAGANLDEYVRKEDLAFQQVFVPCPSGNGQYLRTYELEYSASNEKPNTTVKYHYSAKIPAWRLNAADFGTIGSDNNPKLSAFLLCSVTGVEYLNDGANVFYLSDGVTRAIPIIVAGKSPLSGVESSDLSIYEPYAPTARRHALFRIIAETDRTGRYVTVEDGFINFYFRLSITMLNASADGKYNLNFYSQGLIIQ